MTQQFTARYLTKRNENMCPQKDLYEKLHSSITYDKLKLKIIQIPIN